MNKQNIILIILGVAVIVLAVALFSKSREVTENKTALQIMKVEMDSLKARDRRLEDLARVLFLSLQEQHKIDSVNLANANKNKNEKIYRIRNYGSDSLRRYFNSL